ncbi:myo-inositol-1(or 4)-monophosphatase [Gammaproteobacteria bacterium]|nr:inositol monophosphatase [Gammaproteobacteria bacterium]QOJ31108.1 MAG: inositol monophosphatase [Gammaproteobacteria bacterium]CAG0938662.1 myo-inositol-1(or 4)-monophosphatase [Gammaproteobacteria bacterium]
MQALLNTAVKAARKGGDTALRYLNRIGDIEVRSKARNEFVTQVDHAAEAAIISSIRERYPHHGILAEESGHHAGDECTWIIDPLDGTTNYIHGFPVFSVSIAVKVRGQLEAGVVYDPCRQELFTATRGGGAQLDGRRIRVSAWQGLEGALIGTGFPYRSNNEWLPRYMPMLQAVMENTAGVRRPGSAALDLSYVAAGRLDGFWEFGLSIWDIAAGALMIREAGGMIASLTPGQDVLETGNVIAGSPRVCEALHRLLAPHL